MVFWDQRTFFFIYISQGTWLSYCLLGVNFWDRNPKVVTFYTIGNLNHLMSIVSRCIERSNNGTNTCSRNFSWGHSEFFEPLMTPIWARPRAAPHPSARENNSFITLMISFLTKSNSSISSGNDKNLRKIILIIWILAIITLWFYLFFHRELLDPRFLFSFFQSFWAGAIIIYLIVSIIRWIFLLPSLPLYLLVYFFPDSAHLVFLISMLGIIFSGIIIYQFSEFLWFDEIFANKIENIKIQNAIEKYWFFAVLLWSLLQ